MLHVISIITNPVRYKTRLRLFKDYMARMEKTPNVTLWVVEGTFGNRHPTVLDPKNKHHIHVKCRDELWHKENLVNIGARHALEAGAKVLGWCDGDIAFINHDWAIETEEALEHYAAVQPFTDCIDMDRDGTPMAINKSFAYCYAMGDRLGPNNRFQGQRYGGPYWHPGYAWFFRADAWNRLGGMIERAIVGSGDYHMATSLIGLGDKSFPKQMHPNYRHMVLEWQRRAELVVARNVGFVPGVIYHYYHGAKENRRYKDRWKIMFDNEYDPYTDVIKNGHGVLEFAPGNEHCPKKRGLKNDLRFYFRDRAEDS